jgi:hypothetical protein
MAETLGLAIARCRSSWSSPQAVAFSSVNRVSIMVDGIQALDGPV